MEDTMTSPVKSAERRFPWPIAGPVNATIILYATQVGVRETRPIGDPLRLAVTAALVLSVAVTVWVIARQVAKQDEFQRQVQLSTLTFAFPASLVAAFGIGFFAGEGTMRWADPRDLPAVMLILYFLGHVVAWRRYR